MATGIRIPAALGRIATAMRVVEQQWMTLRPAQRVKGIADAVLLELQNIHVAVPRLEVAKLPGVSGQFNFITWTLQVNEDTAIAKLNPDPVQAARARTTIIAELGDTVVHEARHCEQWYRMARYLAGERRAKGILVTGRELSQRLGIDDPAVCQQAANALPLGLAEKQEAVEWYESVYGSQSSFRQNTFALSLTRTGNGGDWQSGQFTRYQRALAEEEDAWNTGLELQNLYLAGTGIAPTQLTGHAPVCQGVAQF